MRLDDLNSTHKTNNDFNQINKMAHKTNVAAITTRTYLREIWRGGRKGRPISENFLKDAPSKMDFRAWSLPVNDHRETTKHWFLPIEGWRVTTRSWWLLIV
jgi:hypothetical protein